MESMLQRVGQRRVYEVMLESTVPVLIAGLVTYVVLKQLSHPSAGRSLHDYEAIPVAAAVTSCAIWALGRLAYLAGMRRPRRFALLALAVAPLYAGLLVSLSARGYASDCAEMMGELTPISTFERLHDERTEATGQLAMLCRINAQRATALLPGTLFRPAWRGLPQLGIFGWLLIELSAVFSILAWRDRRLFPTRLGLEAWHGMRLALPAGSGVVLPGDQELVKKGREAWRACANPTLWGEPCGQLYPSGRLFMRGEACGRCGLEPRPSPPVSFSVVTLAQGDVDILNAQEPIDAWPQHPVRAYPSQAGRQRKDPAWVNLGSLSLPDVLTTSQALVLVQEWLQAMPEPTYDPVKLQALRLARQRASRLAAWGWFSQGEPDLNRAIPTREVTLASGTVRLRDIFAGRTGWKALQLDIGLVPIELLTGWWNGPDNHQAAESARMNNRVVKWLPVAGVALGHGNGGLWVPRVEGNGLRAWLTVVLRNSTRPPVPFLWDNAPWRAQVESSTRGEPKADQLLSLIRLPPPGLGQVPHEDLLGCRLSDWEWLDRKHLEMIRRQVVVMAPDNMSGWKTLEPQSPQSVAHPTEGMEGVA